MTASDAFSTMFQQMKSELRLELRNDLMSELQQSYIDRRMTIEEASEYLGVSGETVKRMCRMKQLPHLTIGAPGSKKPRILFSLSSLDNWIRQRERESVGAQ